MANLLLYHSEYLIFLVLALGCSFLLIRQSRINRAPEYAGHAVVVSRRPEVAGFHGKYSSGWNYIVTFQIGNDTIELYVSEMQYHALAEGAAGMLRWQNDSLCHFEPDP